MSSSRCHVLLVAVAALLFVVSLPAPAFAQGLTGTIDGTVKDETGGVLPGVTVTLASPALIGGARTNVTGEGGTFRFPTLPPGQYVVTFELAGFQSLQRDGLVVQSDRTVTLDQVLKPSAVAESVTVSGETPLVDVRGTQVATVVDTTALQELPVAHRFSDALNIMPGVQNGLYSFSPTNAVYGSPVTDNVYSVDGTSFVDPAVGSVANDVPYDDIQEVQLSTAGQFAEFGTASGGVFNFITKSGGNQFKGLASGYFQTKGLTSSNISSDLAAKGIRPSLIDHVYDYGGNLGGPVKRNRLWFFGSYYRFDQEQSYSDFPVPVPTTQQQATGKLNAQASPNNRLDVYYNHRRRLIAPFNFGITTAGDPRTWDDVAFRNHLLSVNWTNTLGDRTIIQARGGMSLLDLINIESNAVPGTPVYIEQSNGYITGGVNLNQGVQRRNRYEFKGDVSRFVGSHSIKGGYGFDVGKIDSEGRDQGHYFDTRLLLLNGNPFRVQLLNVEGHALTEIPHHAAYIQDQWVVGSRLTINAGVRYDRWGAALGPDNFTGGTWFRPETTVRTTVLSGLQDVAPRVGFAWDVTGQQKLALKASWGRFYQRLDVQPGVARQARTGIVTYDWIDRNGDRIYQPGEEGTVRSDTRPRVFGSIDPDLKMPYTDSFNIGVEYDLPAGFGMAINGIFKRERDIWNRVDLNKPFDTAYDQVQVVNPLDGKTMTIFSVKPEFQGLPARPYLTNPTSPQKLYRRYDGVEFVLRRRLRDRWMMQTSYNLGKNQGSVGPLFTDHQQNPYLNPNSLINMDGDQSFDQRHMFKTFGLYQLPYGIQVSGSFQYLSARPALTTSSTAAAGIAITGARIVRFTQAAYPAIRTSAFIDVAGEPQGSTRVPAYKLFDLRLEKRTVLGKAANVGLALDIFNVFNVNTITRVQSMNITLPTYFVPAEILLPRAARIAVKFNF